MSAAPLTILVDAPRSAPVNMAWDEGLLDGTRTLLRRTAWSAPAVTIGRFQEWCVIDHPLPSPHGSLVAPIRRITGGGAIIHGDDLTLAWVADCPSPLFPDRSPAAIARRAAEALLPALAPHHPGCRIRDGAFAERSQRSVLDCFARRTPFDLVAGADGSEGDGTRKVGGIALHRRRNRVLVQASLVRSETMPPEHDRAFLHEVAGVLGMAAEETEDLADDEFDVAIDTLDTRYGRHIWNCRVRPADLSPWNRARLRGARSHG